MKTLIATLSLVTTLNVAEAHKAGDVLVLENFKNSDCIATVVTDVNTSIPQITEALKAVHVVLSRNPTVDVKGRLDYHLTPSNLNDSMVLKNITCGKSQKAEPVVIAQEPSYRAHH